CVCLCFFMSVPVTALRLSVIPFVKTNVAENSLPAVQLWAQPEPCVSVCVCVCVSVCECLCMYVCACVCVSVCGGRFVIKGSVAHCFRGFPNCPFHRQIKIVPDSHTHNHTTPH